MEKEMKKTGPELLKQLVSFLTAAEWQKGKSFESPIHTCCEVPGYGDVTAELHKSLGSRAFTCVALSYMAGDRMVKVTVLDFQAHLEVAAISRRVTECVPTPPKMTKVPCRRDPHTFIPT